jgi:hypothetical protein
VATNGNPLDPIGAIRSEPDERTSTFCSPRARYLLFVRWAPGSGVQCPKVEQDMTERYYFETRSDYPDGVNKRVSTLHNFEQRLRQKAIEIRQRDADDLQLPHSTLPSRCSIAASQPTWKSPQFAIHDITPTHVGTNNEVSTG